MRKVQVLGTGCPKCNELYRRCEQALENLDIEAVLEKVEDINKIVEAGVMLTPALVVDGVVLCSGKVPSVAELEQLLR